MKRNTIGFIAKERDGTIYIAECVTGDTAKDTACEKVRRLILNSREALKKKAAS